MYGGGGEFKPKNLPWGVMDIFWNNTVIILMPITFRINFESQVSGIETPIGYYVGMTNQLDSFIEQENETRRCATPRCDGKQNCSVIEFFLSIILERSSCLLLFFLFSLFC